MGKVCACVRILRTDVRRNTGNERVWSPNTPAEGWDTGTEGGLGPCRSIGLMYVAPMRAYIKKMEISSRGCSLTSTHVPWILEETLREPSMPLHSISLHLLPPGILWYCNITDQCKYWVLSQCQSALPVFTFTETIQN